MSADERRKLVEAPFVSAGRLALRQGVHATGRKKPGLSQLDRRIDVLFTNTSVKPRKRS